MDPEELKALQAPLKQRYQLRPDEALVTLQSKRGPGERNGL